MHQSQTIDKLELLGKSDVMHQVYRMSGRLCNVDGPVLIVGESGCGKKMGAHALHYYSHRSASSFHIVPGNEIHESSHERRLGIDEGQAVDSTYYIPNWTSL